MLPSRHIIASLSLGAIVASFSGSLFTGLICFGSGVLLDIDHLLEYLIHFGLKTFNLKEIYRVCANFGKSEEGAIKKIYLVFHIGELAILLWVLFVVTKNTYLLAAALGYTAHLIMDTRGNVLKPQAYFISTRIKNHFYTARLVKSSSANVN